MKSGNIMTLYNKLKQESRHKFLFLLIFALCFISTDILKAQQIDLLIKGGHVIDPKNNINGLMDVAITAGKISEVALNINAATAKSVVNATGLYVTPGLIDMHVHVFNGNKPGSYIADGTTSVPVDAFSFRAGVTTVVDAGSSGWRNFPIFKEQTIDKAQTRVLALLNIVGTGMYGRFEEQDISDMNPEMTSHMINRLYPKILVGIKSAHYWGGFTQVDKAVEAGKLAGVPVMVDFGEHTPTNSIEDLFMKHLRPGDMFTHTFANGFNNRETVVDQTGKLKPFILQAQKRGIIFDVGHGGGAFSWIQAIPAIKQGFKPNVISSDLHTASMNGGMKDMTNLLSKFLNIGMTLEEVILRATWNPANAIKRPDLGHLTVGTEADVAVFNLRKGDFGFLDVRGAKVKGTEKLETELTIRAGSVVWDLNGIASPILEVKPIVK
jgi:dihydroorotase